ncbi:glycosyltransferase family 39 protein [Litorilituus lipolyticus]|uniref:Glycosyltransferase RgtA/B/C/D-like domain-containing protein n=1 Tax=Litorilituus lipolyticus TaxID=2491017 RepID=A0A502KZM0_9GAMM|nr:glycosyltransferase family 39 protein [Litorilituus lipolyticus]TPH17052.1 hypothetical protein EPA86_05045 [Litorilituus lipolyticus]
MSFIERNAKTIETFLFGFIVFYPWYFVGNGVDLTDTGFWLTYYKNFFDTPESAINAFPVWFSLIIGSVTNFLLGGFGVFGFNIAQIITMYLSLYFIYRLLRSYTSKLFLLILLSVTIVFVNIDASTVVNYDALTALFYLMAIYFIYIGLSERKNRYLLISGVVIGLNIFIRLPNLLGLILIISILYFDYISNSLNVNTVKRISWVFFGCLITVVAVLGFMKFIGHFDFYLDGLSKLLEKSRDSSQGHKVSSLLQSFISDYVYAIKEGAFLTLCLLLIAWCCQVCAFKKVLFSIVVFLTSVLIALYLMKISNIFDNHNYYYLDKGIFGVYYILLGFVLFKTSKSMPDFSTIALLSLLITVLIPLGSNTSLRKAISGMYIGLPVILIYLNLVKSLNVRLIILNNSTVKYLRICLLSSIAIFSLITSTLYFASYCDSRKKHQMLTSIEHPLLKFKYTTPQRADVLTNVLNALKSIEKNYEYMFTFGRIPLLQYLSDKKQYIDNPNPLFESSNKIEIKLKEASEVKSLPIVVSAKTDTSRKEWPVESNRVSSNPAMNDVIQQFLEKNNYVIYWESDDFKILVPGN